MQRSLEAYPTGCYLVLVSTNAHFISAGNGDRTVVVLPMAEYEALLEDLADLATIAERAKEPTAPFEEVVARLKQDGYLPG